MKKMLLAIAASAVLAVATLAPTTADARCRGCGIGLGIVGGLAAGAIIGSAIAGSVRPTPIRAPTIRSPATSRMRMAPRQPIAARAATGPAVRVRDPYGNVVGWSRPRFFCPAG